MIFKKEDKATQKEKNKAMRRKAMEAAEKEESKPSHKKDKKMMSSIARMSGRVLSGQVKSQELKLKEGKESLVNKEYLDSLKDEMKKRGL